jgi:hypothetical protein
MHIQDFHSKLTSANGEGALFEALRSLSQVEDPQRMFNDDGVTTQSQWTPWPPMDAHASHAASAEV